MRLLHTSDWHIGRTFHGHELLADQETVLTALASLVREHDVDAVLVSGDLYDRAVPSADAMQLAARVITAIRDAGADVVAISGNHDSAPRLGVFADVLAHGGFHLRTDVRRVAEPVLLGDGAAPVAVYAIPYLEPAVVRGALALEPPVGHQETMDAAMRLIRSDLAARPERTRSVVLAHAFVVGGEPSGSERSIAVGGVESVSASLFDGIDYVALGHLHGRQQVRDAVRYSGSPLPYSFGESSRPKGAWLVDVGGADDPAVQWLDLPVIRPLSTVRGPLDEILAAHEDKVDHYLAVELTDPVRPLDPIRRLRERFPYTATMVWAPEHDRHPDAFPAVPAHAVPDDEMIDAFLTDCRGAGASADERELIADVVAGLRGAEVVE